MDLYILLVTIFLGVGPSEGKYRPPKGAGGRLRTSGSGGGLNFKVNFNFLRPISSGAFNIFSGTSGVFKDIDPVIIVNPQHPTRTKTFKLITDDDNNNNRYDNDEYIEAIRKETDVDNYEEKVYIKWEKIEGTIGAKTGRSWQIRRLLGGKNKTEEFQITDEELLDCSKHLRIRRSSEPELVYTCFLWSKEPRVVLWCLIAFAIIIFMVFPILIASVNIRSLENEVTVALQVTRGLEYIKRRKPLRGRALVLFSAFSIVAVSCVSGFAIYFVKLGFNMLNCSADDVIFTNRGTFLKI